MRQDSGPSHTILVVEDEDCVRDFTTRLLKMLGYGVISAVDGKTALEVLQTGEHQVDLIMTDVIMPQMTGRQFVERLREMGKKYKVIFVSGYSAEDTFNGEPMEEDVSYFQKPFTKESLSTKLREMLGPPC